MTSHGVCVHCNIGITNKRDLVRLDPCSCVVCRDCLSDLEALRGNKQLKCSVCEKVVQRHFCWRPPKQDTRNGTETRRSGRTSTAKRRKGHDGRNHVEENESSDACIVNEDADLVEVLVSHKYELHKDVDAFRICMSRLMAQDDETQEDILGQDGLVINQMYTVRRADNKNKQYDIQRTEFVVSANGEYLPSDENVKGMVDSFCWLHSVLMPISFTPEEDDADDIFPRLRTPKQVVEYKVKEEGRPLFRMLFALATGKRDLSKIDVKDAAHQRQVLAAATALDVLIRALHFRQDVGHTTALASFQLQTASHTQLIELLSRMGLCKARTTFYREKAADALAALQRRLLLDTHGVVQTAADNVQWKDGNGGYVEQTLMVHVNPPTTELKYHLDLSREWGDWKQFIADRDVDEVISQVFAARQSDHNRKFTQILTHLQLVIDQVDSLLSVEECEKLNAPPYAYKLPKDQKGVPQLHRFGTRDDLQRLGTPSDTEEIDPNDDDESGMTLEQRNGAVLVASPERQDPSFDSDSAELLCQEDPRWNPRASSRAMLPTQTRSKSGAGKGGARL